MTPVLRQLHWLPIEVWAQFKVLVMTYKALNGLGPGYLKERLHPYMPAHPLRSAGESLLREPSMKEIRRVNNIGKLKDFLLQHRKDYINAYSHAMSEYVRMTDTERDQIDQDAQIFMRACADAIQQLRTEAHKDIHSPQVKQHREAILDFIEDYLKRVCKLYSEQRAIRVKRVVDKKRLSRLEPEQSNKSKVTSSPERTVQSSSEESEEKLIYEGSRDKNVIDEHGNYGLCSDGKGEDELSPEEIQMVNDKSCLPNYLLIYLTNHIVTNY
ncbi:Syntaxin-18 [Varanus komodoensis]|nr:Syntaxin-18 [Varanus komodoensis]